jgi:hypothetical protein
MKGTLLRTMTAISALWQKKWLKRSGGAIVLLVLLGWLVQVGAKQYLADWLVKNGAERASIARLNFNPFAGRLTMEGMEVESGGRSLLHNGKMELEINFLSLLSRDLHLAKAEYQRLAIDLEQYPDGRWRLGSYTMAAGAAPSPAARQLPGEGKVIPWGVVADRVACVDCRVQLRTPAAAISLQIDRFELERFTTREGQPEANLRLDGRLNGAPLSLTLRKIEVSPELRLAGTLSLSGFQLDKIAGLVQAELPVFAGAVDLNGRISFTMSPEEGTVAKYDGAIEVAEPALAGSGFAVQGNSVRWYGLLDSRLAVAGGQRLVGDGLLAVAGLELGLSPYQLHQDRLFWQGRMEYSGGDKAANHTLASEGSLEFGGLRLAGEKKAVVPQAGIGALSWRGAVKYGQEGGAGGFSNWTGGLPAAVSNLAWLNRGDRLPPDRLLCGPGRRSVLARSFVWPGRSLLPSSSSASTRTRRNCLPLTIWN